MTQPIPPLVSTRPQVFVSYARKDEELVDRLLATPPLSTLFAESIDIWIDRQRLDASEHWKRRVRSAIRRSAVALLCLSPDALSSEPIVRFELEELLDREEAERISVLPIVLRSAAWQEHPGLVDITVHEKDTAVEDLNDDELAEFAARLASKLRALAIPSQVEPPPEVVDRVERFRQLRDSGQVQSLNEAQVRQQFIDPLFRALGWDVYDEHGLEEVLVEPGSPGGVHGVPDYRFQFSGVPQFLMEAKRPARDLARDRGPSFQLRSYGWNQKVPVGVLSDFEELAIYDCRQQPRPSDRASVARLAYFHVDELLDRWQEVHDLLSQTAVARGSLERLLEDTGASPGTTVDDQFLRQVDAWRLQLAEDIVRNNAHIRGDAEALNFAIQVTLDRLLFLRICEARGHQGGIPSLDEVVRDDDVYARLLRVFAQADERYNSGLFHFAIDDRPSTPDTITPNLEIADATLRGVVNGLYPPESPFQFAAISPEILGQVYERFLGRVVVPTEEGGASVVNKPEARRAEGVYYTPTSIVDYIVSATVDRALEGRTLQNVGTLTVLDPACGSGAFLLAAYQRLLDWYTEQYKGLSAPRQRGRIDHVPGLGWRLTTDERRRILVTHIFGVDVDPQAVEVARLALLLKVLEDERQSTLSFHRVLPDLENNVLVGNSLIGPEAGSGDLEELDYWIAQRPLDWRQRFPQIMERGGFDVVIGNPPYLSIDAVWGRRDPRLQYLRDHYADVYKDKTDLLFYFLKRAVDLSRDHVGMIVSRSFLEAAQARKLRAYISDHASIQEVLDFRQALVFRGVGIQTAVLHLTKQGRTPAQVRRYRLRRLPNGWSPEMLMADEARFSRVSVDQDEFGADSWVFAPPEHRALIERIDAAGSPVGTILHVGQGLQTGANDVFEAVSATELQQAGVPSEFWYTRARNSDIRAFAISGTGPTWIYPEPASEFAELPEFIQEHLLANRGVLEARAAIRRNPEADWWRYTWPRRTDLVANPRIICPYQASTNRFGLDLDAAFLGSTDTTMLYDAGQEESLKYIAALLNSSVLTFRFRYLAKLKGGGVLEYYENTVSRLPIVRSRPGRRVHDTLVDLVSRRAALLQRLSAGPGPAQQSVLRNLIHAVDAELDLSVSKLYGLTEDEHNAVVVALNDPF